MHGINGLIDKYATMALSEGRVPKMPKACDDSNLPDDTKKYSQDNLWRQRSHASIAGSLRAYDRLHKADIVDSPECQLCHDPNGDLEHIMMSCPVF